MAFHIGLINKLPTIKSKTNDIPIYQALEVKEENQVAGIVQQDMVAKANTPEKNEERKRSNIVKVIATKNGHHLCFKNGFLKNPATNANPNPKI